MTIHRSRRNTYADDMPVCALIEPSRVEEALAAAAADGISETHQLGQLVRRTLGRWVNSKYRRRPMIIPVVVEV